MLRAGLTAERVAEVCASLGAVLVPPSDWRGGQCRQCYANVQEAIRLFGGAPQYGWVVGHVGPFCSSGIARPVYCRWINHVVWRDVHGQLWEVTPSFELLQRESAQLVETIFVPDAAASFTILSDHEWRTNPRRFAPVGEDGREVAALLNSAQQATDVPTRNHYLNEALAALKAAGFQPKCWGVEKNEHGSVANMWLLVD